MRFDGRLYIAIAECAYVGVGATVFFRGENKQVFSLKHTRVF